jgi:hypothetical protein
LEFCHLVVLGVERAPFLGPLRQRVLRAAMSIAQAIARAAVLGLVAAALSAPSAVATSSG